MAKPSKRRPWAVEIQPPNTGGWYHIDAYANEDEARMQMELARKRAPEAMFRCINTLIVTVKVGRL